MSAVPMMDPLTGLLDFGAMPSLIQPGVSPSNSSADDFDMFEHDEDANESDMLTSIFGGASSVAHPAHGGSDVNAGSPEDGGDAGEDGANKKRGRRPPSTAAKRATHNAVERARRESLNSRFTYLAQQLPMHDVKRASKNAIVEKAIEYVGSASHRERQLVAENASLLTELNQLRAKLGMPARAAVELTPVPVAAPPVKKAPVTPVVATAPLVSAPAPAVDRRSISPRTVPATLVPQPPQQTTAVMPMSMAPTQPTSAASVIQAANTKAATDATLSSFIPGYDWHMAAAQHFAGMDPLSFNPFFSFGDPAAAAHYAGFQQPTQIQPAQLQAQPSASAMNANAGSFWQQYARQAAMPPFTVAH